MQGFRPAFLALERAGHAVTPRAEGNGFTMTLVLCGRHRRQNEGWIAEAVERTGSGGLIVVAGGRTDGIDALRRKLARAGALGGQLAKHHATAFWFARPAEPANLLAALSGEERQPVAGRFATAPGMFSADHVDPGSALLAASLPDGLAGEAADFGAGWGYLAAELARRAPGLRRIDLYEADFEAADAARRNMAGLAGDGPAFEVFWHDLLGESVLRGYDVIVSNPPFHAGRAAQPELGQGMIRAARKALKPGGRLFLVANRQLPYEKVLGEVFAQSGELRRDGGFKVLWARR